jgi:DNA adenine methylase
MPSSYGRYFEPFLGAGSLFFRLEPSDAVLGDQLEPLISTYLGVRSNPSLVHEAFSSWPVDRESYYEVRALEPIDVTVRAAQFIYLNKTAWNGLYRVNRNGGFNVPFGMPKSANIVPLPTLIAASNALSSAHISVGDFEVTLSEAGAGDFVFVDPPYVTAHNNNGFVQYNEKLFSWDDQLRLATLCSDLARRGAHVLITNAAHPAIRDLYSDFHESEISRYSTLAGNPVNRKKVTELIFSTTKPASD